MEKGALIHGGPERLCSLTNEVSISFKLNFVNLFLHGCKILLHFLPFVTV